MELNEKINFLYVTIYRTNNVISTNWYQKYIVSDWVHTENIWNKKLISEILCIKSNKNSINKKEDVSKLINVYTSISNVLAPRN